VNQLDLIGSLVKSDCERALIDRIVSARRNPCDCHAF
jgi:hypothetical protein